MSRYVKISKQIETVNKLIVKAERSLAGAPEGLLRVCKSHGTNQYYHRTDMQDAHGKYLRKSEMHLIKELAQKEYDQRFLGAAKQLMRELLILKRLNAERSMGVVYQKLAKVYTNFIPAKRELIKPYVLPDELFIKNWLTVEYDGGFFSPDTAKIFSDRGERVRSKSEKIIADKLLKMGIPYRYEYPTKLKHLGQVFTDFTLLDIRERLDVKYEHFGMMQDSGYCNKVLTKIEDYEASGYHIGENFLFTMESENHVLDSRHFEQMIRRRFLSEEKK